MEGTCLPGWGAFDQPSRERRIPEEGEGAGDRIEGT
jgi:hypothetical protein